MYNIQKTVEEVLKPVKIVGGIVEKGQTLPILSNILIEQNGADVKFSATDLDIQISTHADVGAGEGNERYTVSAAKLLSTLGALNAKDTITFETNGDLLTLTSNNWTSSLKTLPASDYPILREGKWHTELTLPAGALRYLLTMTHFAMAVQDIRYFLKGVLLVVDHKTIRAVATDTHRLACCDRTLDVDTGASIEAIIPRKTVRELIRILPEDETPVRLQFSDTQICFTFDGITFMSKLVEGKFPDYRRVLPSPETNPYVIEINREYLIDALRRVSIVTSEKLNSVRWILENNTLKIQSVNSDNEESTDTSSIAWDYPAIDTGFNIAYLNDVLNLLKNNEVRFAFANAAGSVLITMPEANSRFQYVVMPMKI